MVLDDVTVLDFPAWPVHSPHHASHVVPPQDGDGLVLAVFGRLAIGISSPLEEGKSIVQHAQVPPQAGVGHDDHPRPSGFPHGGHLCVVEAGFSRFVAQQRGESVLLQGGVLGLGHG